MARRAFGLEGNAERRVPNEGGRPAIANSGPTRLRRPIADVAVNFERGAAFDSGPGADPLLGPMARGAQRDGAWRLSRSRPIRIGGKGTRFANAPVGVLP